MRISIQRSLMFTVLLSSMGVPIGSSFAQTLEWKSLGGPKNSSGNLAAIGRIITTSRGSIFFFAAGLYRSDNRGTSWLKLSNARDIAFDADSTLYAAGTDGVFSSTNFGTTWKSLNDQLPAGTFGCMNVTPNGTLVVATSYSIYRSIDKGVTWDHVGTNIPISTGSMQIAMTPKGSLLCNFDYKSYRSTDDGLTWNTAKGTAAFFTVVSPSVLIVGYQDGAVSRSTDDGLTWTQVAIPKYSTYTFGMPAMDAIGRLYMGSSHYSGDGVVLSSNDSGLTWQYCGMGADVMYMAFGPDNELYAGTFRTGLYRTLKPVSSVAEMEKPSRSIIAIPNPVSSAVSIICDPSSTPTDVSIFDLSGRELAGQTAAHGLASFDLSHVPDGRYGCTVRNAQGVQFVNLVVQH